MDTTASRHDIRDWWRQMVERRKAAVQVNKSVYLPVIVAALGAGIVTQAFNWVNNRGTDSTSVAVILQHQTETDKKLDTIIEWQKSADQRYVSLPVWNEYIAEARDSRQKAQAQRDDQSDDLHAIKDKLGIKKN